MTDEHALKEGEAAFLAHLAERAHSQDIPIEATRWHHAALAESVELTVVSRRKAYIFSLPVSDLTDPHRAAHCTEAIRLVLTAIKENIPRGRGRAGAR